MRDKLERYQRAKTPIKFNMAIQAVFMQSKDEDILTVPPVYLVTDQQEVYQDTDLNYVLTGSAIQLGDRITAF